MMNGQGPNIRFMCGMCTYNTEDDKAFLSHYGDQHKREMAYWCRECGRTFTSPGQLVVHIKSSCTKIKSVTMRCGVTNCSYSIMDPFQFMQHIKIAHKGTHLFPCRKCRKLFTIPSCLIQHIQTECSQTEKSSNVKQSKKQYLPKSSNSCPDVKPATVNKTQDFNDHKKKEIIQLSDAESDPDDPSWNTDEPEKQENLHLRSRIEIDSSASKMKQKILNNEPDGTIVQKTTNSDVPSKEDTVVNTPVHQILPQRYERWNDWWKAVSGYKSSTALASLLKEESLRHFFICMSRSCDYSTDNETAFARHQSREHSNQKLPCRYCLREIDGGLAMVEHSVSMHGTRRHQCSRCLYRASTKSQVALHFEALHGGKPVIYGCETVGAEPEVAENAETEVAMPYICRVGRCKFETCNPEEFVNHNRQMHTGVSVYPCFYCGTETFKLDALMRHYRLHGIYNFQCAHCVHGTNTIDEILLHQCLNHAERRMQVYVRPSTKSDLTQAASDPVECTSYPEFSPDYSKNFLCGVEGCRHVLCGLPSYKEHLLASHHCNSFFPCPHCTAISVTAADLDDHLTMHGPNMYTCGMKYCAFFHWRKRSVEAHCRKTHSEVKITVIREATEELLCQEIKTEPEEVGVPAIPLKDCETSDEKSDPDHDSRINFQLQLLGSISVQGNVNLGESTCTFGGESPEDVPNAKRCKIGSDAMALAKSKSEDSISLKETLFRCPFCEFSSESLEIVQDHLYRELEYTPFRCNLCSVNEISLPLMEKHIADLHPRVIGESSAYNELRKENLDSWIATFFKKGPTSHEQARAYAVAYRNFSENPIARIEKLLKNTEKVPPKTASGTRNLYNCYYCNFGPARLNAIKEHSSNIHIDQKIRLKRYPGNAGAHLKPKKVGNARKGNSMVCEKCGHINKRIIKPLRSIPQKKLQPKEGYSYYGKNPACINLDSVWVVPPQTSSLTFKVPVVDLMNIMNFNVLLRVTDLRNSLYRFSF